MSVNNFIPELWSTRLLGMLDKTLVYAARCNRNWEGDIKERGDTVRINAIGPVTIGDYVKNVTSIAPETLNDQQSVLIINNAKYFAFEVDDVDAAQSGAGGVLLGAGMDRAAYGLRDAADQVVAALYTKAGSITAATPVNSVNALAAILTLGQALDEKNVPTEGRWCVIPPWLKTKLVLAKVLVENNSNEAFQNGFVGRVGGFDIAVSNNVPVTGGTNYKIMAGTNEAIAYADQINKVEAFRPENAFSDAVKGLHLYGAEVVQPDALAVGDFTVLAEP